MKEKKDIILTNVEPEAFRLTLKTWNTIRAHRHMLIASSPVFDAMLLGEKKEEGEVILTNVERDAFPLNEGRTCVRALCYKTI